MNPMIPAFTWFLNFFNCLPMPIKNLIALAVGLYAITVLVHIIMR